MNFHLIYKFREISKCVLGTGLNQNFDLSIPMEQPIKHVFKLLKFFVIRKSKISNLQINHVSIIRDKQVAISSL